MEFDNKDLNYIDYLVKYFYNEINNECKEWCGDNQKSLIMKDVVISKLKGAN
jgi:hypothetical protein